MADKEDDEDEIVDSKDHAALMRRLEKLVRQKSELTSQLAAEKAKVTEFEKAMGETSKAAKEHAKILAERDALAAEKSGWGDERAIMSAGVRGEKPEDTQEAVDAVRLFWGRVPEDKRPKGGLTEWLGKREGLPKGVLTYLPAQESKGSAGDGNNGGGGGNPNPNTGVRTPNGGGHPFDVGQLNRMTDAEFAAQRTNIWQELGFTAPTLPEKRN